MQDEIKKILEIACNAPSGDNHQPWRFEVKSNTIDIHNLPERDPIVYNYRQQGSIIAHGCLIETLSIAASHFGYSAEVLSFPDTTRPDFTARVTLEKSTVEESALFKSITTRATNRNLYKDRSLTGIERDALIKALQDLPEVRLVLQENLPVKRAIGGLVSINEQILLEAPILHHTFFKHILWTEQEEKKNKQGLYFKTLGLKGPQIIAFKLFRFWPVLKLLNKVGISKFVASENAKVWGSGSAHGALVVDNNDPATLLHAGRAMQRIWLTVTDLGLHMQPLAGILFLARRLQAGETSGFSQEQQRLILETFAKLKQEFGITQGIPAMFFRVGDGGEPAARSSRLAPQIRFAN